jgi:hypothetical protein
MSKKAFACRPVDSRTKLPVTLPGQARYGYGILP